MNLGLQIFLEDSTLLRSSSFSISSPTRVIFWCVCLFVLMVASYLDGCEVIAFYFHPVYIVVLAREVGKSCFFSLRVEITWSSVSRWMLFYFTNGKLTQMLRSHLVNRQRGLKQLLHWPLSWCCHPPHYSASLTWPLFLNVSVSSARGLEGDYSCASDGDSFLVLLGFPYH